MAGISAIGASSVVLSGAFSVASSGAQALSKIKTTYEKYDCYKWFYEMNKGEMAICLDKTSGQSESVSLDQRSLFYVLWWQDPLKEKGPWPRYEFEKIQVQNGNQISFTFKDSSLNSPEKKITVARAPAGASVTKWSDRLKDLDKLNGKPLKTTCKLTTESGTQSVKLDCSSVNYKAEKLDLTSWPIKRSSK